MGAVPGPPADDRRLTRHRHRHGADAVALVLAVAIGTAINVVTLAVFYDAVRSDTPGLSENSTQLLTAAFGGIVGVLGGYLGGRAVERAQRDRPADASGAVGERQDVGADEY